MTDLATKHGADSASDDAAPDADAEIIDDVDATDEIVDDTDAAPEPDAEADSFEDDAVTEDAIAEAENEPAADDEALETAVVEESEVAVEDEALETAVAIESDVAVEDTAVEAVESPVALDPSADAGSDSTAATAALAEATAVLAPVPAPQVDGGEPTDATYAWAPAEPAPKKRRTGLWIGLAAGAAVIGLVAASIVLIAPGTSVAGVGVGFLTEGAASDALTQRLDQTTIVLTGEGGDVELTAADLGASIDADALAATAYAEHPAWNVTQWFSEPIDAIVHLDAAAATPVLRAAAPSLYTDPVDATLEFDEATVSYITTPGELGTGVDVEAVREAIQAAFVAGDSRVEFTPVQADVQPETQAHVVEATAKGLNDIIDRAGFYIGTERVVPVSREVAASWLTVTPGDRGSFDVSVDAAAIQPVVDTIAATVDVAPVNNSVITNSAGTVLREESNGTPGRAVDDTSDFAADYAEQLTHFDPVFELPMTEVPFTTVTLARRVDVNLSTQRAYFYENDVLVRDIIMSSGVSGSATPQGRWTVNGYSRSQNMGCFDGAPYCVENVPWVTWFAPDVGFHGASSLRSSLGFPQSHGCVNMWDSDAKWVYDWTANGTEVNVHT
ncbi:hypothetical protein GCM10009775_19780 [Microbacterium aoyamense]|uniref:L,D-TPase catalytic domain-containing protein n=1 Tax=Microbacterium aoyamense TaxID=344166 RepID=A0ABN2PQT7_9MICO|nr:L,D-transpeptidase family protein [Microbacterium aoyamense]